MSELLFIVWFTFTFWAVRGVTEGPDVTTKFPKLLSFITSKYSWALQTALMGYATVVPALVNPLLYIPVLTLSWALAVGKGAKFALIHRKTDLLEHFLDALLRSSLFLVPFLAHLYFIEINSLTWAGIYVIIGVTSYATTQWLINLVYNDKFYKAEAVHQILTGLFMGSLFGALQYV